MGLILDSHCQEECLNGRTIVDYGVLLDVVQSKQDMETDA